MTGPKNTSEKVTDKPIEKDGNPDNVSDWPWALIISVAGLLLAGIAYSLGDAYYSACLRFFSIDSSAFPIDHSTHLIYGVWGGLNATLVLQAWFSANAGKLLVTASAVVLYFAVLSFVAKFLRKIPTHHANRAKGIVRYVQESPNLKMFLSWTTVMLLSIVGLILLFQSITVIASIPSAIGESAGNTVATKDKVDFDLGCEASQARCYRVTKDGVSIGQGYVIAQSPQRVALYYKGETSQVDLTGAVMQTTRKEPASTRAVAPSPSSAPKASLPK